MARFSVSLTVRVTVEAPNDTAAMDRAGEWFLNEQGSDNIVDAHAALAARDDPLTLRPDWAEED